MRPRRKHRSRGLGPSALEVVRNFSGSCVLLKRHACVQLPTSAVDVAPYPHLLLCIALRRRRLLSAVQQSIHISCPPRTQPQTRRNSMRWANCGRDRQTDAKPLHTPAPHTMRAVPINALTYLLIYWMVACLYLNTFSYLVVTRRIGYYKH